MWYNCDRTELELELNQNKYCLILCRRLSLYIFYWQSNGIKNKSGYKAIKQIICILIEIQSSAISCLSTREKHWIQLSRKDSIQKNKIKSKTKMIPSGKIQ